MNMECFKDGFREAGKLFILLGFFSPILFSQDQGSMDQDFLSSLPEAVQEELEKDTDQPQLIDKLLQSKPYALKLSLLHLSEPTRRTPTSSAVFCLKKKKRTHQNSKIRANNNHM